MQQTEKYKLNLIESSDPFLPDALNQNTQKVEDAMTAHEAKVDSAVAGLDQRVAVFEAKKFAYGSYTCNDSSLSANVTINLGFTPKLLIITDNGYGRQINVYGEKFNTGTIFVEGGFKASGSLATGMHLYFAFA